MHLWSATLPYCNCNLTKASHLPCSICICFTAEVRCLLSICSLSAAWQYYYSPSLFWLEKSEQHNPSFTVRGNKTEKELKCTQLLQDQSKWSLSSLVFSAAVGGCSLSTPPCLHLMSHFAHFLAGCSCWGELSHADSFIIIGLLWSSKDKFNLEKK